jgi:hypothetical protein
MTDTPSHKLVPEVAEVLGNLLDHYLNCYDGNEDALALKARSLLDAVPASPQLLPGEEEIAELIRTHTGMQNGCVEMAARAVLQRFSPRS